MSSAELAQLITLLRSNELDLTSSPQKARADFSASIGAAPVAADITFESGKLAGLPVLASTTPGARTDQTLLYIHGGAFVIGNPTDYRSLSGELGRATGVSTVSLDYRLAPEHPFPAAVDDCVAAYRALLEGGIKPADIVLAGDSAGGGLVIATLVAARDGAARRALFKPTKEGPPGTGFAASCRAGRAMLGSHNFSAPRALARPRQRQ